MKKKSYYLLFIILVCISCNVIKKDAYNPTIKYSANKLKDDFSILHDVLKTNHPSLYWYSTKDSIDNFFSTTYACLQDSLTEQQFRKRVAWVINKIRCGHTVVRSSKNYSKYYSEQRLKTFPVFLKVWDDSAVVVHNLSIGDTDLRRGTVVISINGIPIKKIIDSICQLISTDGYSNTFKYQLISFNFPAFYNNTYGVDAYYAIKYIDRAGNRKKKILQSIESTTNSLSRNPLFLPAAVTKKQHRATKTRSNRNIKLDSSLSTALVSVNTFSKGKLIRFFRSSFRKIKKQKVENLVLDLRLNSGGSVLACTRLSQYLIDRPFNVADTVATFNRSFPYKKFIKPWLIYWLSMRISGRRLEDEKIHFRYFEKHYFKPKRKNHFAGNIYLLTGGYTFSAATLVASNLKGQHNVTIVGEETGGGSYGNSAMLITKIVLPNTGLRITLPLFRMVLDATRLKTGRGIIPDVEVKPSSNSIKMGVDAKMEKVMEIIRKKKVTS
ncbi:MAG TPA: S41 family peptidase [Segetibacter sp.]